MDDDDASGDDVERGGGGGDACAAQALAFVDLDTCMHHTQRLC